MEFQILGLTPLEWMNEQFWERLRGMNKDKFGLAILERALKNERKYLKSLRRIACRSVSTFKFQTYVVYFYHQAWSKTSYLQEYRLTVENSPLQNHEQSIIPFNVRALNSRNKSKLVNLIRERTLVARQWGKKKKIYIYTRKRIHNSWNEIKCTEGPYRTRYY